MAQSKRHMTAEDLYRMQLASDIQISPNGHFIIFCVQRVEPKREKKFTNLWLVPTKGGQPHQFTYGDHVDHHPRWSPDGKTIAFLSNRRDEKQFQIFLIPIDGGEARPLTSMKGDFANFEWSSDGRQLVCQFRKQDDEAAARAADPQKQKLGVVARHYTTANYKMDGVGYFPHEKWHIWTINSRSGKAKQLTEGDDYHEQEPHWFPDNEHILLLSNRSLKPDINFDNIGIYVLSATDGTMRSIETPPGAKFFASVSPDGQWITYLGSEGHGDAWRNIGLWLVPSDGTAPSRNLTHPYDVQAYHSTLSDTVDRGNQAPIWSPDSQHLYLHVSKEGSTGLYRLNRDGGGLQPIIESGVVGNFSFDTTHSHLAYFHSNATDIGQLWLRDMKNGRLRQLSRLNSSWLRRVDLGALEEVWFEGPDKNRLQGWILKPPDFDANQTYPSILEIHGGPWLQYGDVFVHEFYYLAAQGYVVYFTNPRGGVGYGEAHNRALHRQWGSVDYADLMAFTDYMSQLPYIDSERMGVTGGSYGGYMTTWIIGHTHRFKAAVAQRVVSNGVSFWGSSDAGYFFEDVWSGKPPWEDIEPYWQQSPIKYIGNVTTPTLVIHSEQDLRCPLEQGEQLFKALREVGVDTELLLFPEESHGLSRMGRTDRRITRLTHILRWFNTYLT